VEQARKAAEEIGFPVVVKGLSSDVLHKTEAGAVRLGISNTGDLQAAFEEVARAVRTSGGESSFRGVLLEQMLPEPVAEVIIGSVSDVPGFHKIVFGLGGIWVEIMKDVGMRLAPLVQEDAEEMIEEIRAHKILEGFRGNPPADRKALVNILMNLSTLVWDLRDHIEEIDVNPVLVYQTGACAVDALIRLNG
jgi:acetyltransferase